MKRSKIVYSIILVVLVAFILYIYNGFNGNPISQYASRRALKKYLTINYPNKNLVIKDKGTYNFKFSTYDFKVMDIGNASEKKEEIEEYGFSIRGFIKLRIVSDSVRNDSIDRELSDKLSDEASNEVMELLIQRVSTIKDVYVGVETFKDTYDKSTVWSKDLKLSGPINMHIVIDSTSASKEDIYDAAVKIQDTLAQSGYVYGTININGNVMTNSSTIKDKMGYVKYSMAFKKDTKLKISDVKEMKK